MDDDFQRYLNAKRTVDDRSINAGVWNAMNQMLDSYEHPEQVSVLEIGAGTGTMLKRMLGWGAIRQGKYRAIDLLEENTVAFVMNLREWTETQKLELLEKGSRHFRIRGHHLDLELELETVDLFDFLQREDRQRFDLLIAHAFLDLFDIPALMPRLVRLVRPGGGLYLTINFDGHTIFEPVRDAALEEKVIALYHRTMDERLTGGHPSGDSRAGRHLFQVLRQNQLDIAAVGSSDWVVYPQNGQYPQDEAYFLRHILHFFEESLRNRPEISAEELNDWLKQRRGQIERGELVYMAHQLDFLARKPI